MKKLLLFIITITLTVQLQAQFNKVGRTSMQFLKIGIGAREAGMGEACIANLNDVNAVFWNPAALSYVRSGEIAFHYASWFADLNVMAAAAGINLGGFGVIGLSYVTMDYGDLQEALVTSPTGGMDTRTGATFSGKDLALGITYAKAFTDKLSIGFNIRYLREDLFKYSSSQISFDVGSYYETGWKGIRLAMIAQNFTGQARWLESGEETQQSYELPLIFKIGASIDLVGGENLFLGGDKSEHLISVSMDALHSNDYAERFHVGLEYKLYNLIVLRGGYKINYEEGNLSAGLGLSYSFNGTDLIFDYAYVNYDYLDSPHRLSLSLTF